MANFSTFTNQFGVSMARALEKELTNSSNTYVGIGHISNTSSGITTTQFSESIEDLSQVFRNLIAIKKINAADLNLVIPDELYEASTYSEDPEVGNVEVVYDQFNSNTNMYSQNTNPAATRAYPLYEKRFYVRNTFDQVFLCISNNNGAASNVEPVLRPENFSSGLLVDIPEDGYVWRYLYTIPSGLKEKFYFQDSDGVDWMPVVKDSIVSTIVKDGAIEQIRIVDGGTEYNSNAACTVADIITIVGDGINAVYYANVVAGAGPTYIGATPSSNTGSGYSYAIVTASGGNGDAVLKPLISPPGGFGKDPANDLGAKYLALSVEIEDTLDGNLPVSSDAGSVAFRQVSVIKNPLYTNNSPVSATTMSLAANVEMSGAVSATAGDVVYQGLTLEDATFSGNVISYLDGFMLLNNTVGTFTESTFSPSGGNGLVITNPTVKRSGEILYVQNIDDITRNVDQFEQVKVVFKF